MRLILSIATAALLATTFASFAQSNGVAKPPNSKAADNPPPPTSNRPNLPAYESNPGMPNARAQVPDRPAGIPPFVNPPPFVSP